MQPSNPLTEAPAGNQVVADRIADALITILRAVRRRGRVGMDQGQLYLLSTLDQLATLDQHDATRLTDLATAVELDSSTVSRQVRALEDRRLVHRRPDPEDRRAQLLSLTPAGAEALDGARAQRRGIILDRLRCWSEDDVLALEALLTRLAQEVTHG